MTNSASIDRISNLSDDLLCHILSFLPTKLAFTTTVFSKRWTPLFKLLTSLHFEYESLGDEDSFLHFRRFVDTITLSTQLIKTFHLKCSSRHWHNDRFIETVNFLNGCPILEDLQTDQINYLGIFDYREEQVRLKTLSKLIRAKINASHVPIKAISNVHFLQIKMLEMPFGSKINSYYRDFLLLQNLVHLEMSFNHKHHLDDVVEVLQNCPKLQSLSITKHAPLLRVMKITSAESSSSQDTLKELNSCPRISSECELSIS